MSMSTRELWIMTAIVEARAPVEWFSRSNRDENFNLPEPGFSIDELVDLLVSLVASDDIALVPIDGRYQGQVKHLRAVIERLVMQSGPWGPFSGYIGLTERGGERWEALARPRWQDFVDRWSGPDLWEAGMAAVDPSRIEGVLRAWPYLTQGEVADPESISWEPLRPWNATYWKQFDAGHRVHFRTTLDESKSPMYWYDRPAWVVDLMNSVCRWYSLEL